MTTTAKPSATELQIGSRIRLTRSLGMLTHDGPLRAETGTFGTIDQIGKDGEVRAWLDRPKYNVPLHANDYELLGETWSAEQRAILAVLHRKDGEATLLEIDAELAAVLADVPPNRAPSYWLRYPIRVLGWMGLLDEDYGWVGRGVENSLYRLSLKGTTLASEMAAGGEVR